MVVSLDEFRSSERLFAPMLEVMLATEGISAKTWLDFSYHAWSSDLEEPARASGRRVLELLARDGLIRHGYLSDEFQKLQEHIPELVPTATLRFLRRTRPSGVRRDEEEQVWWRRNMLARAHSALHRYRLAKRLREKK